MTFRKYLNKFEKDIVFESIPLEYELTRQALNKPKTPIFFPNFKNGQLVINLWASREGVGTALGVDKHEIVDLLAKAVDDAVNPKITGNAPSLENVKENFDLRDLPIPKYYPDDGGRYITSGVVISEYNGKRNLSFHRMMLIGKKRFTIRLVPRDLHKMYKNSIDQGEELEIAVAIGLCPSILLAAATSVDYNTDEFKIASSLRKKGIGKKVEVAKMESGLLVPAHSEYILQGRITKDKDNEGPFVDITGTYDHVRQQPIVEIDKIWHKDDPVFHALLPGGREHYLLMGLPRESVMKREIGKAVDIVDVRLTDGGCSWLHGVVSINKKKEDDPEKAIERAFKAHTSLKKVTVVDHDINVFNDEDVEWALATRFQPDEDLTILKNQRGSSLDPSAPKLTSKWGLDATKPWEGDEFQKAEV